MKGDEEEGERWRQREDGQKGGWRDRERGKREKGDGG